MRAQDLFTQNSIKVVVGVPAGEIKDLVKKYLSGELVTGSNVCDH